MPLGTAPGTAGCEALGGRSLLHCLERHLDQPKPLFRLERHGENHGEGGKESKSHSRSFPSAANSTVPRFAPNPVDKDSALLYFVCRSIALRTSVSIMVSLVRPEEMIVGSDPNKSKEMIYERII